MGIDELTYGVSKSGVEEYINKINLDVLDNVIKKIQDTDDVKTSLRAGWAGKGEEDFEASLENAVGLAVDEIESVKKKIETTLNDLKDKMFTQDTNIYSEGAKTQFTVGGAN